MDAQRPLPVVLGEDLPQYDNQLLSTVINKLIIFENELIKSQIVACQCRENAPLYLIQLATPFLAETEGSIVNVSSITGTRAVSPLPTLQFPNVLSYCISKSALDQLTKCASLGRFPTHSIELGPRQIRVNSVKIILTQLHRSSGIEEEAYQQVQPQSYSQFLERGRQVHPLRRNGLPEEVAEAVLFLADKNKSGFITGELLHVDGGKHAVCPR
ncbi:tropinone reductase 2-like [Octopus sinensis]|uniref:Tropinone reductase 2-like n=1 Tax=Octopus sinensis TaxID=2607531 RepID=A0A7E6EIW6_9MOLL|nr:tropinone reductase 2-like [Octopus sinensis]